jgi:hypothetical protein
MIRKIESENPGFNLWENMPAPESVIVRCKEELYAKLQKSEKSVEEGKTVPAEIMFEKLRKKYGFSS